MAHRHHSKNSRKFGFEPDQVVAAAKELVFGVASRTLETSLDYTAEAIARVRAGEEGQAGMKAFLERHKPPWIDKNNHK